MIEGYLDFTAGQTLTAEQVEDLLLLQTVMRFASASARDTALSGVLREGLMSYLKDVDRVEMYTGSAWVRVGWGSTTGRTGCEVSRVAGQSISNSTFTQISWDTETFDSDGFIAVTSSTATIPTGMGGLYSMTARAIWSSDPGTDALSAFTVNGFVYSEPTYNAVGFTTATTLIIPLVATNTITFGVRQSSGAPINVTGALWLFRLGP